MGIFFDNHLLLRYFHNSDDENKVILKADSNLLDREVFDKSEVKILGKVLSKIQTF